MSERLSRNDNGYTERELTIYRTIILILYCLIILASIVIGPLLAILFKNPYCGLYGFVPACLFIPMRMFIDRIFPRLTTTDSTSSKPKNILHLPTRGKVQPDP